MALGLADLAEDPRNPRAIEVGAAEGLGVSLTEFGDLSGFVYNERTGQLVAGHQRRKQLLSKHGNLKIEREKGSEYGFIRTPDGESFTVRFVDWDEATQRAANIAANSQSIAGHFTEDVDEMLAEVAVENEELYEKLLFDDLRQGEAEVDVLIDDDKYDRITLEEQPTGALPQLTWVVIAIDTAKYPDISEYIDKISAQKPRLCESTVSYR